MRSCCINQLRERMQKRSCRHPHPATTATAGRAGCLAQSATMLAGQYAQHAVTPASVAAALRALVPLCADGDSDLAARSRLVEVALGHARGTQGVTFLSALFDASVEAVTQLAQVCVCMHA